MITPTRIEVTQSVSAGHRLKDYDGICSSLHGHNLRVVVRIISTTFLDFKRVSDGLHQILQQIDHAMVLEKGDPLVQALRPFGLRLVVLSVSPTTEALATWIFNGVSALYLRVDSVTVHETDRYAATALTADTSVFVVSEKL